MDVNYEPTTLITAFEQQPLSHTFLRDTFFQGRDYPPTNLIEFDFKRGRRKMAPFVAPLIGGKVMEREGFETRFFRAPRIAPIRNLRIPDLEPRMMGENIYSGRTPADRAAELLADDAIFLDGAITRREEWMCREVLVNGQLTITADNGYQNVISFLEWSGGTVSNHVIPAVRWDQPTAVPLTDLEAARKYVIKTSGVSPNIALMGADAASAFVNNAQVSKFLDNTRFQWMTVAPIIVSDAIVRIGRVPGLEIYSYDEYFEDDLGQLFPMLPANLVILASTSVQNKIVYGAFTQLEDAKAKRYVTYQTDRIPFVYGDEENGHLFYRLTSCPLPMPMDILGIRIIEALVATFERGGDDVDPTRRPYFDPNAPEGKQPGEGEGETGAEGESIQLTEGSDHLPIVEKESKWGKLPGGRTRTTRGTPNVNPEKEGEGEGESASGEDDLEGHTVDQLKEIADEEGVDLAGAHRKDDIIQAIRDHREANK